MSETGPLSDIAFTPAVKAEQIKRGSRAPDGRFDLVGDFRKALRPGLEKFLAEVDTAYLATATADGQPYAQHRGGPKGFIKVVDDETMGSPISAATGTMSRQAIWRRTTRRSCS